MDHVIATYRNEDGDTLREYTHSEKPWRETRGDQPIPNFLMMEYYHN
ncbi:MAG: hypothetical protein HFG72_07800 [Hungatella sp.]|nr:hypothetical protein [Hungatella sp.]